MGTLRELVEFGAAPVYVWGVVQVVDRLLRHLEMRLVLKRVPEDQFASVIRALYASQRSAK